MDISRSNLGFFNEEELRYFSEDSNIISAQCPVCGDILDINIKNIIETENGFLIKNTIKCSCGKKFSKINLFGKSRIKQAMKKGSSINTKYILYIILFLLLLILFLLKSYTLLITISTIFMIFLVIYKMSENFIWGPINPEIICPHCKKKGKVHITKVKRKAGISGGKVMGGLLTGGLSLLGTGLSRKQKQTQAHCGNCNSTWDF